ncbi:transcription factor [Clostridium paraputrificum]|uniref:transcription factor n=1 Tax=Clostridium paraputrificum TaxID=29363 RepID=UPI00233019B3|nr:transcription factor [Clostridium paraputrificum]MDB2075664.1 transcription factor [Clostridium paraputrificum]MDB2079930.1 transcription factor [Clostridium paraputrificum]
MGQTLINRQNLAKRWDYESTKPIEAFEKAGVLTRVPLPNSIRYSLEEIEKIESLGQDINPLSPLERRRLERKIEKLERENEMLIQRLNNGKIALGF